MKKRREFMHFVVFDNTAETGIPRKTDNATSGGGRGFELSINTLNLCLVFTTLTNCNPHVVEICSIYISSRV